jgi:hypothetical protein
MKMKLYIPEDDDDDVLVEEEKIEVKLLPC